MRRLNFLIMICIGLAACAQSELKLNAIALKDTVALGESTKIRLSLEGIQSDIFRNTPKQEKSIFGDIFNTSQNDNNFSAFIEFTPQSLGKNTIGPYKISLLGKDIWSNEVIIFVIKQDPEYVYIEMPTQCLIGERIDIKIKCKSSRIFQIQLKENDIFNTNMQSNSLSINNGVFSKESKFTVTPKKKGQFEFGKGMFENLPEYIVVEPIKFEIE